MPINLQSARNYLQEFKYPNLFIEVLGWSNPLTRKVEDISIEGITYKKKHIAQLSGVVVIEISGEDIPLSVIRKKIHKQITDQYHENLLIFTDNTRTRSLWYWIKRQENKQYVREHIYIKGQPGDLFLTKLNSIVFDLSDFDNDGHVELIRVLEKLQEALDIEKVTKKFYNDYQNKHIEFISYIKGINNEKDRKWYASVLMHRLMFVYFLQKKFFLNNGDDKFLQNKLIETQKKGKNLYYKDFLKLLFFEGFAKPEEERSDEAKKRLGNIKYLNGGLFLPHPIELRWNGIDIPDKAFENIISLFESYSWNLNDTPGGDDNEINPDVLGYIFEKYINQKAFGAYYTRPEITEYLSEKTIYHLVLDKINCDGIPGVLPPRRFNSIEELLLNLDSQLCKELVNDTLPSIKILDPACGSGAFLVAAMKTLINIYAAIIGKIEFNHDYSLKKDLDDIRSKHKNVEYYIKKRIITDNLFGVDIMEEAVEIAKLRLFLALVASADNVDELEPLPNIDFNIRTGNSLIGLTHINDDDFDNRNADLFRKSYKTILSEKNREITKYREATSYAEDLCALREEIDGKLKESVKVLNDILCGEFSKLGIQYEQAIWNTGNNSLGKPKKRAIFINDINNLKPFHWGFEFDEIFEKQNGFDAILTNPPWEIIKPNSKEFFEEYSDLVSKKKMTIQNFEKEQAKLLKDNDIRKAWLGYLSEYPHVSAFYRSSEQFINQISIVNGKKAGSDINLYKLFLEQCFNLLREGGYCGIVIPSGIYTDLGAKQLREMLVTKTSIKGLFGFENRKEIFEGVHRSFKFVVMNFKKGGHTDDFPAAFMRHDVKELNRFPQEGSINISTELVRKLSPDSFSIMEFKNQQDIDVTKKMLVYPLLGEDIPDKWNFKLTREFDMTNDSYLFKQRPGNGRLPLYEGKMIWQFYHCLAEPRYWVKEDEGRKALVNKTDNSKDKMGYQKYRIAYRSIASNTNERTLISTVIPRGFCGNSLIVSESLNNRESLFLVSVFNSFLLDWFLRSKVTTNINMFFIYQLPIPRLTEKDNIFNQIVSRSVRLICTSSEYGSLASEFGIKCSSDGITDPVKRLKIRAEIDAIIAHLYGLTESEVKHILATFPLVEEAFKAEVLKEYSKR